MEKVASLHPDLIVINDLLAENYDQLSKIAPTVFVPYDSFKNVCEEVAYFGDLLNKQEEAAKWPFDQP